MSPESDSDLVSTSFRSLIREVMSSNASMSTSTLSANDNKKEKGSQKLFSLGSCEVEKSVFRK